MILLTSAQVFAFFVEQTRCAASSVTLGKNGLFRSSSTASVAWNIAAMTPPALLSRAMVKACRCAAPKASCATWKRSSS